MFIKNNTSKDGLVSLLAEARRLLRRKCPSLDPNIELVPAKVPILKIYDTYYDIEIDLSCSNENAVRNTNLLYCYTQVCIYYLFTYTYSNYKFLDDFFYYCQMQT